MSDGLIALDDQAAKYVPQWKDDPCKSKITIRQLGSHTSGIEDAEENKAECFLDRLVLNRGICIVLGDSSCRPAMEMARNSDLPIYV